MPVTANSIVERIDDTFSFCLFNGDSDPEYHLVIGQGVLTPADFDSVRLDARRQEIRALLQELPQYTRPDINLIDFKAACSRLHLHDEADQHCEIEKLIQLGMAARFLEFGQALPLDPQLELNDLDEVYFVFPPD
jgi:hypothetical protein